MRADHRVFGAINAARGRGVDRLFAGVTELGSIWASAGAGAALAVAGHRRAAARGLAAAGAMWSIGQGLKRVFGRPRPYDTFPVGRFRLLIGKPQGTSWPSSHPAVLLAFVTAASYELGFDPSADRALLALAGLVGVSRVALGVHFPSDVVGGLLLGRAVGLLAAPAEPTTGR
jgi:undecaprenyl-diphosphatase